ncbi:DinI family protein [Enterobacter sp. Ap-916]|uniref:DinI-like family protein n=1 Tax=Enterobacteriaceae TaxID=543 RepID=UPI000272AE0A|nr:MULTISPECIES: DinI-like family protein [unclassified Enterobacter]EJF31674.1 virulence protein msgA [Enterobacter sp. Ag1]NIF57560.1 DinI family protein [Enterobacter sp. Ap-867]NIG28497.1 DinI family protein [Enterobacter sp. Ap-916]
MFVELVYDKRNVEGLPGAKEIILAELTRRVHRVFPEADVRVKPMESSSVNSDCTKNEKEKLSRLVEEMFDEAEFWLVSE